MEITLRPLARQVIVITGASSGIGLATALAAAREEASLVLVARSKGTLNTIERQLRARGRQVLAVEADTGQRAEMDAVVAAAMARFGRIDTWINNAGVAAYGRVDEVSEADNRRLFDVNYWGVVNGSLAVLPLLRANGGALINIGSEASDAPIPLQVMYSAAKYAVKAFTDGLRMELEMDRAPVSVTLVQPAAVDTPLQEHAANYLEHELMPPAPMTEPETVAAAILKAAVSPMRHVRVGAVATINATLAMLMPMLGETTAGTQLGRQQLDELPRDRHGRLYVPSECGRVHGRGSPDEAKAPNSP